MSLNEETLDIKKAENYLLGILTDDEAFDFECDVFPDENLSEQLETVRLQLSEKYLADELNRQQRRQFENHFLGFPYNSEILAFQKSLRAEINERNGAAEKENADVPVLIAEKNTDEEKTGFWTRIFGHFSSKPFTVPAFAALLMIVVGGIFLYKSRTGTEIVKTETPTPTPTGKISPEPPLNPVQTPPEAANNSSNSKQNINTNQNVKEKNQNADSQAPIPKADVPPPGSPIVATIILFGKFRDVASEDKPVVIGRKTQNINLRFQYPKESSETQYKNYKLVLETISGKKVIEKNLSKDGKKSGDSLTENISPGLLQTGKYRLRIVGVSQSDREETVDSDTFFVKRIG